MVKQIRCWLSALLHQRPLLGKTIGIRDFPQERTLQIHTEHYRAQRTWKNTLLTTETAVPPSAHSPQSNVGPFPKAQTYSVFPFTWLPGWCSSSPPPIQHCWQFIARFWSFLSYIETVSAWYLLMDWRKVENSNLESHYFVFMTIIVLEKHMVKYN